MFTLVLGSIEFLTVLHIIASTLTNIGISKTQERTCITVQWYRVHLHYWEDALIVS